MPAAAARARRRAAGDDQRELLARRRAVDAARPPPRRARAAAPAVGGARPAAAAAAAPRRPGGRSPPPPSGAAAALLPPAGYEAARAAALTPAAAAAAALGAAGFGALLACARRAAAGLLPRVPTPTTPLTAPSSPRSLLPPLTPIQLPLAANDGGIDRRRLVDLLHFALRLVALPLACAAVGCLPARACAWAIEGAGAALCVAPAPALLLAQRRASSRPPTAPPRVRSAERAPPDTPATGCWRAVALAESGRSVSTVHLSPHFPK